MKKTCTGASAVAPSAPVPGQENDPLAILSDYPPDDCCCDQCRFVHRELSAFYKRCDKAGIKPFNIGIVTARFLGQFAGYHTVPGKLDRLTDGLTSVIIYRALQGEKEGAAYDAAEETRQ
jgi:hypothetical protein